MGINLQATLAGGSSQLSGDKIYYPHHPIVCTDELYYYEDGEFACNHISVGPEDPRTQRCLIQSIATLILEIATETL